MLHAHESRGLALARGFIVLIMPAVHTVLIYSNNAVKAGWIGTILGFLAEQPGAQLFMLQMGLFIGIGRQKTVGFVLKRFVQLLIAGYLLNFIRLVLPYWCGGIPESFLQHNEIPEHKDTAISLLLIGDILQFASLGYLFCQALHYGVRKIWLKIAVLIVMILISPFVWKQQSGSLFLQYATGLFNGLPPIAFFPFFPWIAYPVAGLIIGQVIKQYHGSIKNSFWIIVSVLLIAVGLFVKLYEPPAWNNNFYRLGIGGTIFHLGAAIAWMVVFVLLSQCVAKHSAFSFLEKLSNRITSIYFLQWIIILWLMPVFGFNRLGSGCSLVAIVVNSLLSFVLAGQLPLWFRFLRLSKKVKSDHLFLLQKDKT